MAIYPSREQIEELMKGPADQPVVMINLLRFQPQLRHPTIPTSYAVPKALHHHLTSRRGIEPSGSLSGVEVQIHLMLDAVGARHVANRDPLEAVAGA